MNKSIIILGFAAFLFSCSSDATHAENDQAIISQESEVVQANKMLTLEVDGMVCQMGCGGSIRQELNSTGAVSGVEFDFEDDRETNIAKVSFDENSVSVDEIVKSLELLNDGQFKVRVIDTEDIHEISVHESSEDSNEEDVVIESFNKDSKLPNLLDILSKFLID